MKSMFLDLGQPQNRLIKHWIADNQIKTGVHDRFFGSTKTIIPKIMGWVNQVMSQQFKQNEEDISFLLLILPDLVQNNHSDSLRLLNRTCQEYLKSIDNDDDYPSIMKDSDIIFKNLQKDITRCLPVIGSDQKLTERFKQIKDQMARSLNFNLEFADFIKQFE